MSMHEMMNATIAQDAEALKLVAEIAEVTEALNGVVLAAKDLGYVVIFEINPNKDQWSTDRYGKFIVYKIDGITEIGTQSFRYSFQSASNRWNESKPARLTIDGGYGHDMRRIFRKSDKNGFNFEKIASFLLDLIGRNAAEQNKVVKAAENRQKQESILTVLTGKKYGTEYLKPSKYGSKVTVLFECDQEQAAKFIALAKELGLVE